MATTTTTEPTPLTPEEQKQLEQLQARQAAVAAAQAENDRKQRAEALTPVKNFLALAKTDKITAALDTALNSETVPFLVRQQLQSFKVSYDYNMGQMQQAVDSAGG